ncbi:MAG: alpha/beta hydrolase [Spirosomataceae bacterium]
MKTRKMISFVALFYGLLVTVSSCFTARMSDEDMQKYFANSPYRPKRHFYDGIGRRLHYVAVGDTLRQPLLFVHGSPGSWDNFKAFLKDTFLLKHCHLMSVDRPGLVKPPKAEEKMNCQGRRQPCCLFSEHKNSPWYWWAIHMAAL